MRFREDKPEDLARAREEVAAWRARNPQGTAEQLLADIGHGYHQDYGPVLRSVLFSVDLHAAKIAVGISITAREDR